jgi:putative CRISPR-associated protein (TIGR02619 family)
LFAPANLGAAWVSGAGSELVERVGGAVRLRAPQDVAAVERAWRRDLPAVTDDKRVSAEYSAMRALRAEGRLADEPQVVLVHTDTTDGELAARLLAALIERDFEAAVVLRGVTDLDVTDRKRLAASLGRFMHEIAQALRAGEPRTTVFAALGGYKVMTSLGYLTGAYCRYGSIYVHEDGQALHEVPWVPVKIDPEEFRRVAPLARRAHRLVEWDSLTPREQQQADEMPWLFARVDEILGLSPFGEFLAQEPEFEELFRTRVRVAREVEAVVREQADAVRRDVEHLLAWLPTENTDHKGELHHEVTFGHHGTQYALYKHGGSALRMAWRYDAAEDVLYLRWVWTDHGRYEREAKAGHVLRSEPSGWEVAGWGEA